MIALLDTHILIWVASGSPKASKFVQDFGQDATNTVLFSAVSGVRELLDVALVPGVRCGRALGPEAADMAELVRYDQL